VAKAKCGFFFRGISSLSGEFSVVPANSDIIDSISWDVREEDPEKDLEQPDRTSKIQSS